MRQCHVSTVEPMRARERTYSTHKDTETQKSTARYEELPEAPPISRKRQHVICFQKPPSCTSRITDAAV